MAITHSCQPMCGAADAVESGIWIQMVLKKVIGHTMGKNAPARPGSISMLRRMQISSRPRRDMGAARESIISTVISPFVHCFTQFDTCVVHVASHPCFEVTYKNNALMQHIVAALV